MPPSVWRLAVLVIDDLARSVLATQGLVRHHRHRKAQPTLHVSADGSTQNHAHLRPQTAPLVRRLDRGGRRKLSQSPRLGGGATKVSQPPRFGVGAKNATRHPSTGQARSLVRKERRRAMTFETSSLGVSRLLERDDGTQTIASGATGQVPLPKEGINSVEVSPSGLVEMVLPSSQSMQTMIDRTHLDSPQEPLTTALPAGGPGSPGGMTTAGPLAVSGDAAATSANTAPAPAAATSDSSHVGKWVCAFVLLTVFITIVAAFVLWRTSRNRNGPGFILRLFNERQPRNFTERIEEDEPPAVHAETYRDRRLAGRGTLPRAPQSSRKCKDTTSSSRLAPSETTEQSENSEGANETDESQRAASSAHVVAANEALRREQEKNVSRASQKSRIDRKREKKKVNWNAIDGACAEILQIEESRPDISVVIRNFNQDEGRIEAPEIDVEVDGFGEGRALKDGLVWKLNADVQPTSEDTMGKLSSWRRRRLVLQRCQGKLGLLYISEKENGTMVLGAILQDAKNGRVASVRELPSIRLEPLDSAALYKLSRNLHEYDLAFACEKYRTDEEYEKEVPHTMQPITISWVDDAERPHRLVIGLPLSKERASWLKTMKDSMGVDE